MEKAEDIGLEVEQAYLAPFRACFNSRLNDSITPMYRLLGTYVRPLGEQRADGEQIPSIRHRSDASGLRSASEGRLRL